MTSKLRNILTEGIRGMRAHNRLLVLGGLALTFPVLFFFVFNGFLDTARSNVETAEKKKIAFLHDSVVTITESDGTDFSATRNYLEKVKSHDKDITEVRLVKEEADQYIILYSFDPAKENSFESATDLYQLSRAGGGGSLIIERDYAPFRAWQAVRTFEQNGQTFYLFSEHTFASADAVLAAREQQAFLLLSVIFAFFIATAYWLATQINWHKKYETLSVQLKERDLFTNMIAHEFRTPLTAIRGYNSFLAESTTISEKEKTFVEAIKQSTDRQLALVNDFLEVARIQSGKLSLEFAQTDIQPTILAVVDTLKPQADAKNLTLTYHKLAVPVVLNTDQKRLFQVLQNLISNAIKYTEKGGVDIAVDATPLGVSIRIKDTGMGITAEDQQKLFAPFSRVGGVEQTKITGTGLGMWITKQLVEALRGSISIESIKGVGTHVIVTFRRTF